MREQRNKTFLVWSILLGFLASCLPAAQNSKIQNITQKVLKMKSFVLKDTEDRLVSFGEPWKETNILVFFRGHW